MELWYLGECGFDISNIIPLYQLNKGVGYSALLLSHYSFGLIWKMLLLACVFITNPLVIF